MHLTRKNVLHIDIDNNSIHPSCSRKESKKKPRAIKPNITSEAGYVKETRQLTLITLADRQGGKAFTLALTERTNRKNFSFSALQMCWDAVLGRSSSEEWSRASCWKSLCRNVWKKCRCNGCDAELHTLVRKMLLGACVKSFSNYRRKLCRYGCNCGCLNEDPVN